jgi:ABC-type transport system involved in cytochrome bd biosynthesis fused ATPase/permease subunit
VILFLLAFFRDILAALTILYLCLFLIRAMEIVTGLFFLLLRPNRKKEYTKLFHLNKIGSEL